MKIFQASKISPGVNKIFPHKIIIGETSVTISQPGVFSNKEKTIPFSQIASVHIDSPLVGFSSIKIETSGNDLVNSRGFTKAQVVEMKELILEKIS